jgi:tRNA dimethylallyltransferase
LGDVRLRVICGATAAGKTAIAMALADRFPIAVVSADSRQLYRGFDIGTAKPSAGERARVPHFGVDVAEPAERYSAARWASEAAGWLRDAAAMGRTPVVVGGTGFYIGALTQPLFDEPPLDPARRRALERALAPIETPELARWVRALDPPRAHLGRAQLLRAVEVALLTGRPITHWFERAPRPPRVRARYLLVEPGPAIESRIVHRIHQMLDAGWADETRELAARIPVDAPAWNATGYRAVRDWVCGAWSRDEAVARVALDTRRYAKRQRTWFRNQLGAGDVTSLDPTQPGAVARAAAWWEENERA